MDRSDVCMESSPPLKMSLSAIDPPSTRIQGDTEVRSQNYGSEPNIDHVYEGGNMRLSGESLNTILLRF